MISWFGSSSTVLTLTIKTTNGELEDTIQIQSDESVMFYYLDQLSKQNTFNKLNHTLTIYTGDQFKDCHR